MPEVIGLDVAITVAAHESAYTSSDVVIPEPPTLLIC
jgi:hypothetical protein